MEGKEINEEWTVEGKAIWAGSHPIGIATSSQEAHQICDAHNAALSAERKAWDKQFTATMTVLGATQKELEEAREQIKTLVDALNEIAYDETIGSYKACDLASNALAKAGVKP